MATCTLCRQPNTWIHNKMINIFSGKKLLGVVKVSEFQGSRPQGLKGFKAEIVTYERFCGLRVSGPDG